MNINREIIVLSNLMGDVLRRFNQVWEAHIGGEINHNQYRLLYYLKTGGMQEVVALAEQMSITPGAVSCISDKMIEKGLITRTRSEEDRRIVYLQISEEGERVFLSTQKIQHEFISHLFKDIPEADIEQLKRTFERLQETLIKLR